MIVVNNEALQSRLIEDGFDVIALQPEFDVPDASFARLMKELRNREPILFGHYANGDEDDSQARNEAAFRWLTHVDRESPKVPQSATCSATPCAFKPEPLDIAPICSLINIWGRRILIALGIIALILAVSGLAHAQNVNPAEVVAACGTPPAIYPSAGQRAPQTVDTNGNLCAGVTVSATVATSGLAISVSAGASTSGVAGTPVFGAVTTSPPSYSNNTYNALSLDTAGNARINCITGCSGGTTDTDDGTVAGGQSTGLALSLPYVWDGANWKRSTIGTAGTASTQVLTIQGIASMTKLLVTPDSVALPANQSVNVSQINAVTPLMGAGNTGTGSPRVTIASDQVSIPTASTLQTQTDTVMVGGVNIKEINAVTPLMGNGTTGTGSQRVTIASDNTAFSVNNTQQGTASHQGTLTNNNAAPSATNLGVLPQLANAAVPTWTEGDLVLQSTTLKGYTRTTLPIITLAPYMNAAVSGTAVNAFATSGDVLDAISCMNSSTTTNAFVQIFNTTAASVTPGSTSPAEQYMVPFGGGLVMTNMHTLYTNGISLISTTTAGGGTGQAVLCTVKAYVP